MSSIGLREKQIGVIKDSLLSSLHGYTSKYQEDTVHKYLVALVPRIAIQLYAIRRECGIIENKITEIERESEGKQKAFSVYVPQLSSIAHIGAPESMLHNIKDLHSEDGDKPSNMKLPYLLGPSLSKLPDVNLQLALDDMHVENTYIPWILADSKATMEVLDKDVERTFKDFTSKAIKVEGELVMLM
jgi:hypothetical protein